MMITSPPFPRRPGPPSSLHPASLPGAAGLGARRRVRGPVPLGAAGDDGCRAHGGNGGPMAGPEKGPSSWYFSIAFFFGGGWMMNMMIYDGGDGGGDDVWLIMFWKRSRNVGSRASDPASTIWQSQIKIIWGPTKIPKPFEISMAFNG
jgi:hypothetical protein